MRETTLSGCHLVSVWRSQVDRNVVFGIVALVLGILVLAVPEFLQAVVGIVLIVVGVLALTGRRVRF